MQPSYLKHATLKNKLRYLCWPLAAIIFNIFSMTKYSKFIISECAKMDKSDFDPSIQAVGR